MSEVALVVGLGVTGESVCRHLLSRGWSVVAVDERPTEDTRRRAQALGAGVDLVESPGQDRIEALVRGSDCVVLSPGVSPSHRAVASARQMGVPLRSEIEIALGELAGRKLVAITGTNGKTTVATLVTAMLVESGIPAVAAGNIGLPLIDAVATDAACFVLEVSSFQLDQTATMRPAVAAWLNFAEDHLDWHPSLAAYAEAKARIWMNQTADDVTVINNGDPVIVELAAKASSRILRFGYSGADWTVTQTSEGAWLTGPDGERVLPVNQLPRQLPIDVDNALAALAIATSAGASASACATVLAQFQGLPHRVQLVGHSGGVDYYDDSKATTPASVLAALQGFSSVVLIAGGRNKGLDLDILGGALDRVRAVVAIGESAGEVESAFAGRRPVARADSMLDAVKAAKSFAQPGDAVLLSPGCASFDWYSSYAERGEDFTRIVAEVAG